MFMHFSDNSKQCVHLIAVPSFPSWTGSKEVSANEQVVSSKSYAYVSTSLTAYVGDFGTNARAVRASYSIFFLN